MLAFKIMDDPFVGTITFCRIYSGKVESGRVAAQLDARQEGARRAHAADAREQPRGHQGGLRGRHRRARRPQGRPHRRHALRSAEGRDPRADGVPGAGHRDRRSSRSRRPTRRSSASRWRSSRPRIRPSASRPIRNRARPSSRAWASSTSTSRSTSCAGPTRSTPISARRRWPIARRSRRSAEIDYTHKKQTGGYGPVRPRQARRRAERAGRGLRVRVEDRRRLGAEGVHPRRREGPRERARRGRARRLPGRRLQGRS